VISVALVWQSFPLLEQGKSQVEAATNNVQEPKMEMAPT
jgi:hypothetical protein